MNLLYFDTTQDWIHVLTAFLDETKAVHLNNNLIESSPKEASYRLVSMIQTALQTSNIKKPDCIVVPNGPGSFTGIRITVTTARDLSQLWSIPVVGFDSAHLYLIGMENENPSNVDSKRQLEKTSLICLDGKQGKYYTKFMNGVNFSETKDQTPTEIIQSLEVIGKTPNNWYYTGTFPNFYPKDAIKIEATNLNLSSILQYSLEQIKQIDLKDYDYLSLLPNYIRGTYVDQK
ncbi:tRNA threonylcarbamoyl adenosine modification protein YeaZ [Leptospira yanagawae serovar Saopaulo str. Sao Paulo = ATCC 700523]|uniref:tRNA threonylcarbamoyl adenosine modification protein YeaZ n=1 Tax=Leptospira yanagawae serovar Saopaulo str. Sao Paulo = ATCC 700523 TaxID=1249483 RepID=A0A5E8HBN9_9LEPT|nr:tRNA (adenosine(37)-N6)-threonylcarbamoyltransferase complex dimerization subunit type 1 TsaB [Leptospira yanagawae]EOQ88861.1 tRNA threonylcarbamoyl adenosine modification protein YeaZ [Leptospira yanagawae serovar Saopaulo str. Sao Paulo = ATCC 700523]